MPEIGTVRNGPCVTDCYPTEYVLRSNCSYERGGYVKACAPRLGIAECIC